MEINIHRTLPYNMKTIKFVSYAYTLQFQNFSHRIIKIEIHIIIIKNV